MSSSKSKRIVAEMRARVNELIDLRLKPHLRTDAEICENQMFTWLREQLEESEKEK